MPNIHICKDTNISCCCLDVDAYLSAKIIFFQHNGYVKYVK